MGNVAGENPLLWRMDGIDTSVGMEYAAQDAELYREILSDYMDSIEEQARAIESAVAERDLDTFTIEIHSLKSTSRTIGALKLSGKAKELEDNGRNRQWDPILESIEDLLSAYRGLYFVIRPYLVDEGQEKGKKPVETGKVCRLLSDLSASLEAYDSDKAEEILSELSACDFKDEHAVCLETLFSALGKFDYETCRAAVSRWRDELL